MEAQSTVAYVVGCCSIQCTSLEDNAAYLCHFCPFLKNSVASACLITGMSHVNGLVANLIVFCIVLADSLLFLLELEGNNLLSCGLIVIAISHTLFICVVAAI